MKTNTDKTAPVVLIVDDETYARRYLTTILEEEGYICRSAETAAGFWDYLHTENNPDLVLLDVRLPDGNGLEILEQVRKEEMPIPVIIITAYGSITEAVHAMKIGAFDLFTKPFDEPNKIKISIKNALEHHRLAKENKILKTQLHSQDVFQQIIGKSDRMQNVFEIIRKAVRVTSHILIEGESGTGKELVAEAIHNLSDRKNAPFIPINCAALPEALLESALFGYEKGAFTGAVKTTRGFFEEAHGGILFLDEIGDAPASVQAKILRAVEDEAVYRVGRTKPISVNVRLIFATNKDLGRETAEGRFRQDLYYRINIIKISLPSLNERREDIPILVKHFFEKYSRQAGLGQKRLEEDAIAYLLNRNWPGNVRELKNLIERVIALHPKDLVTAADLIRYGEDHASSKELDLFQTSYEKAKRNFEKTYFEKLIARMDGDLNLAAESSGIHLATIYRKIKSLGLKPK